MVWAGISEQSKTPLHFIDNGTLNGVRYRDEILDVYVQPLAVNGGNNFIFMDDNAHAHRARIVTAYLRTQNIAHMDWLARSSDLNTIEHCWDMLQQAVNSMPH